MFGTHLACTCLEAFYPPNANPDSQSYALDAPSSIEVGTRSHVAEVRLGVIPGTESALEVVQEDSLFMKRSRHSRAMLGICGSAWHDNSAEHQGPLARSRAQLQSHDRTYLKALNASHIRCPGFFSFLDPSHLVLAPTVITSWTWKN